MAKLRINFIKPSPQWIKKHGNVYCANCRDKSKITLVPTYRHSVVFKRKFATCEGCKAIMIEKLNRDIFMVDS